MLVPLLFCCLSIFPSYSDSDFNSDSSASPMLLFLLIFFFIYICLCESSPFTSHVYVDLLSPDLLNPAYPSFVLYQKQGMPLCNMGLEVLHRDPLHMLTVMHCVILLITHVEQSCFFDALLVYRTCILH
jgi:hypothetical protein